ASDKEFHALKEASIPTKKLLFVINQIVSEAKAKAVYNYLQKTGYQVVLPPLYEKVSYRTEQNKGRTMIIFNGSLAGAAHLLKDNAGSSLRTEISNPRNLRLEVPEKLP
ncbi:34926_t:CDS:2, partial [Gigaspora margarita]